MLVYPLPPRKYSCRISHRVPTKARNAPHETDLSSYLLQDIFTEVKLPEEFLNDLAKRFQDDGLVDVIGPTVIGISEEIGSLKFNENHQSAMRVTPNYP